MRLQMIIISLLSYYSFFSTSCVSTKPLPLPIPDTAVVPPAPVVVTPPADTARTDSFFLDLMAKYPSGFDSILANRKSWNVQVIYTAVNRGSNGMPALNHYYFNVDSAAYFYPASTVKLPVSLLALEKLNALNITGLDKYSTMITEAAHNGQTAVYNDPTAFSGTPSIAHYIKKIMMVSDNDAYNRLYEFVGQAEINTRLQEKGYTSAQLLHRLSVPLSTEENKYTNPVKFLDANNKLLYHQPMQYNQAKYPAPNRLLGTGYYDGGKLVSAPMDFSQKNKLSLEDLHQILISLVFPEKVTAQRRFNLTEDDRNFLLKYMSQLPTESTFPSYAHDSARYWPAYCKFLLLGSSKAPIAPGIRIFNKVGDAYGQLTDVAYIIDTVNNLEFFLSATIYCNQDGILNDDKYNYDEIGFPFLKNIGEAVYQYELNRTRAVVPDLSPFHFRYDR